jgi:hypothetical protein
LLAIGFAPESCSYGQRIKGTSRWLEISETAH